MKTYRRLFDKVTDFSNLLFSARQAQCGKRFKPEVVRFNFGLEGNLLRLQSELETGQWRPGEYSRFTVFEPKERQIVAAPYRDRVVHHALCNVIEPLFDGGFIEDSYACREGKGTHAALDRAQAGVRECKFALKCDIKKFFFSINHEKLTKIIEGKIACGRTLDLIRKIIASDSIIGVPIGNLTSQLFANIYLNELDRFVKQDLLIRHYVRYMDDFIIFGNSKSDLARVKIALVAFLHERLSLEMNERKFKVLPARGGVAFLGFTLFPCYRRLNGMNVIRFKQRFKFLRTKLRQAIANGRGISGRGQAADMFRQMKDSLRAWVAHAEHGNTWKLRTKLLWEQKF